MTINVGIMGYGTIGKRVADAVILQKDMKLAGVMAHSYNFRIRLAHERGIPVFAQSEETRKVLKQEGIETSGMTDDLLRTSDIMVDASPKPYGLANREKLYKPNKVKAVFQGGEKDDVGQVSFNAQSNYEDAVDKDYVRVVSCNTTGLSRSLQALHKAFSIEIARATLVRRAADPSNVKRGPVNAIVPAMELPSHHGPDVRTVIHDLEVFTTAMIVPTTLMHLHTLHVKLKKQAEVDEILDVFNRTTRLMVMQTSAGISSTAGILEYAKDRGSKRGDMMDLAVWDKGVGLHHNEVFFMQAVHQESIVVPENIDAIRAMMGEHDAHASIVATNRALGLHNPERFDY
ncbi:MAG: type II glyceraldehyde-3-phosphate dehydrogenase [DPANN group archaeon]|nr:type II glyceraldehyde-3-phosphate dehydrogenase [DPANN group archaeon]